MLMQNQYDALICIVFLRRLPNDAKALILKKVAKINYIMIIKMNFITSF